MKNVIDNFSSHSTDYANYRPSPTTELYDFLYSKVKTFETAWDCGTGNGQIAAELAKRFKKVYASDISAKQLELAPQKDNIIYKAERAEKTSIEANTVDLITVAQAVHWFDFDAFNKEVLRVAKPNAIIALVTYYTPRVNAAIDTIIDELYWNITRPYWDKERQYVDDKYLTIPFPYKELASPPLNIPLNWNADRMLGYLRTWSGVKHYVEKNNADPVLIIEERLRDIWKSNEIKQVIFPLFLRVGQIVK